jgi:hypothetical protein
MADVTGTVLLRGEGGAVQAYDLPLRPAFADAVAAGRLVVVDEDGTQVDLPDPDPELARGAVDTTDTNTDEQGDPGRPAKSAPVADWRTYAVALGCDEDQAAAMTKAQAITWADQAGDTTDTNTDEEG